MSANFGGINSKLTRAVNALARSDTLKVKIHPHASQRMEQRDIDLLDVITCLTKGKAYGPVFEKGELRSNVVHRGCSVRVVIGDIEHAEDDWSQLLRYLVVTVIEAS